jgi:hypothetical protein
MSAMGNLSNILGLEFIITKGVISMSQKSYILNMCEKYEINRDKRVLIPFHVGGYLSVNLENSQCTNDKYIAFKK